MRIGMMLPPYLDQQRIVGAARRAEELGYDFVACGEHVFFHAPTPNAFVALAAAAGATERIRLLSAVTVLPVYPAALAAKLIATLDGVSDGRFELGVGVGGEYPAEMTACGVPVAERGARTDETLTLLARLFRGERVHHEGRFTTIDGQVLDPLPVQRPGPPVWVGGRSAAAVRRAARHADVWMPYMVSPERLAASLAQVRDEAVAQGRRAQDVHGAIFCWSAVGTDGPWARRTAVRTVSDLYQQDFGPLADRYLPSGTPAQVTDRLGEYAAAGAESLVFSPACPDEHLDRMATLFIEDVAPALRATATVSRPGPT